MLLDAISLEVFNSVLKKTNGENEIKIIFHED